MDQPGKVANPARGQLNRENNIPLSPCVPENLVSRDGTAEPVSRDRIFSHERGQGSIHFSCSSDHGQDWQPYPVDPYSCYMCDHTYIHNVGEKPK